MKFKKMRRLLLAYTRQNLPYLITLAAFAAVFAIVFNLYNMETEVFLYASALCLLLGTAIAAVRFYFFCKRHREYLSVLEDVRFMLERLPVPQTLTEKEMQQMLAELKRLLDEANEKSESERRESIDFYTTWIHQIKTPISVMRMMLEENDTAKNRELLAELFRIEQYAEMVLNYLRLGSETSDYVFKEYDIDGIIRQAVRKYAPLFIRRRIRLDYTPVNAKVITDEKWLLFIIEQLLSNSIKYTFEGSVSISFTEAEILKISDTGIGIAAEDLPRIFEKGFTGYNGRSDKKSTGLGLYLCKTAADKLNHRIYAKSVVGKGTTVSIDLHKDKISHD